MQCTIEMFIQSLLLIHMQSQVSPVCLNPQTKGVDQFSMGKCVPILPINPIHYSNKTSSYKFPKFMQCTKLLHKIIPVQPKKKSASKFPRRPTQLSLTQ